MQAFLMSWSKNNVGLFVGSVFLASGNSNNYLKADLFTKKCICLTRSEQILFSKQEMNISFFNV